MTTALLAAAAITTGAASAHATFLPTPSYTESGDAGQTLATAQNAGAFPGTASTISGTIANGNDADLYSFNLAATTTLQFALTSTTNGIDTGLFLFNSTGQALFANNDSSGTNRACSAACTRRRATTQKGAAAKYSTAQVEGLR